MPINKTIKYVFLAGAVFFQLYLAYASTIYFEWNSSSFLLVALIALVSIIVIVYYVCVVSEREKTE